MSTAPTISESLISTHQIDDLRMIGLNHRSAAMDLRERLAIGKDELATVLQRLQSETDEVVALSTCNRTELYWVGGTEAPQSLLATLPGADAALLEQAADVVYSGDGLEVVRHVFRLACGLDSMIIGETQILHQMKTAYEFAQGQGCCGKSLNALFQKTFGVAKAVHTDTRLMSHQASVPAAAIGLVRAIFDDLSQVRVVIVGTGEIATVSCEEVRRRGATQITAVSRTPEQRIDWAAGLGIDLLGMDQLTEALATADVVIACTDTTDPVILPEHLASNCGRRGQPLVILDLGVPRNVDERVKTEQVYLRNVDDLKPVVEQNRELLTKDIADAEQIIADAIAAYTRDCRSAHAGSTIEEFRTNAEGIAADELEAVLNRLSHLSEEDQEEVKRLVHRVVGKMLHQPTKALRSVVDDEEVHDAVFWVRRIFGLGPKQDAEGR